MMIWTMWMYGILIVFFIIIPCYSLCFCWQINDISWKRKEQLSFFCDWKGKLNALIFMQSAFQWLINFGEYVTVNKLRSNLAFLWYFKAGLQDGLKKSLRTRIVTIGTGMRQGHPTTTFGMISVRKTIWDLEFSEHFF